MGMNGYEWIYACAWIDMDVDGCIRTYRWRYSVRPMRRYGWIWIGMDVCICVGVWVRGYGWIWMGMDGMRMPRYGWICMGLDRYGLVDARMHRVL